tara:strand:+ start:571 stop:1158 length:588 start_codon:yes stop_codon:yes gene_type:complete
MDEIRRELKKRVAEKKSIYKTQNSFFENRKIFRDYKVKFEVFIGLEVGTKIGKENNNTNGSYELYHPSYYQKLSRWYYSENRDKTIYYLKHDFEDFAEFLQTIITRLEKDEYNFYSDLVFNVNLFLKEIIQGLYNLKQTYSDYSKMKATIDSIILTLLDFKDRSENSVEYNKNRYNNIKIINPLKIITKSNSFGN